jgi:hypothetical protein
MLRAVQLQRMRTERRFDSEQRAREVFLSLEWLHFEGCRVNLVDTSLCDSEALPRDKLQRREIRCDSEREEMQRSTDSRQSKTLLTMKNEST